MNSQESLINRLKFEFPQPISKNSVIDLLSHLAQIGYVFKGSQEGFINSSSQEDNPVTEDYISKIHGAISRTNPFGLASISFHPSQFPEQYPKFKGLTFDSTVGYEWEELGEQERQIIEDLKKDLHTYFTEIQHV